MPAILLLAPPSFWTMRRLCSVPTDYFGTESRMEACYFEHILTNEIK